ncbi:MAG: hypothetical protein ACRD01_11435 [Terriglobales bacterium]
MTTMRAAMWLQTTPDIRDVSWWLPHNPAVRDLVWLVVVCLNLAVLIWFLWKALFAGKQWSLPQTLRQRGRTIAQQIAGAEASHQQAQQQLAAVEHRLAGLPAELKQLEQEAEREAEQEYQRLAEASRRDAERIVQLGRQEIEAAAKLAQKELQGLAAALAVDLARQRIQERLTPEQDEAVVRAALAGMSLSRDPSRTN